MKGWLLSSLAKLRPRAYYVQCRDGELTVLAVTEDRRVAALLRDREECEGFSVRVLAPHFRVESFRDVEVRVRLDGGFLVLECGERFACRGLRMLVPALPAPLPRLVEAAGWRALRGLREVCREVRGYKRPRLFALREDGGCYVLDSGAAQGVGVAEMECVCSLLQHAVPQHAQVEAAKVADGVAFRWQELVVLASRSAVVDLLAVGSPS